MTDSTDLVADQVQRLTSIDPLLPPISDPGFGHTLVAAIADGARVTGVLDIHLDRGQEVQELRPYVGRYGGVGMDAVLRALRARFDRTPPDPESVCTIVWPSRDADCTGPLLAHGLLPVLALGVRIRPAEPPRTPRAEVRQGNPDDASAVLRLARQESEYSALFSVSAPHPNASADEALAEALRVPGRVWVARQGQHTEEITGVVQVAELRAGSWEADCLLPAGRWGQLLRIAVRPDERGRGVGRALSDAAHGVLDRAGLARSVVWYSPLNPLASVFWHRQGYRPLWNVWQCHPADVLR
ncbi:GNAT family N-acetyltransferase [Saccharomonospora xinjiangensis]|uniref:GNAT family N-acetyltransferase n=1 Tax=Saccharomonospora xinjiangensis TaxID=75294 RepID=UPI00350FE9B3